MDIKHQFFKNIQSGLAHIALTSVLILAVANLHAQTPAEEDFSFVFMTDVHIRQDDFVLDNFRKAITKINALKPDLVLSGGDQVYDVIRGQPIATSLFELFKKESAAIQAPVYTTIGNHELFGIYPESPNDSTHHHYKYGMYEEHFGPTYHSFDHKGWHFVVLNNLDAGGGKYFSSFGEEQLNWLEADLKAVGTETPVVFIMHIPLVSVQNQYNLPEDGPSIGPYSAGKERVLELIKQYNVRLVLQGHLHFWEDIQVLGGTRFITGGAIAGRPSWRGTVNGPRNFLHFTIRDGEISYQSVNYE